MKPPKWTDVYPQGSKAGDEELKFFIALARNPKFQWRSTAAIAKESGLTKERVEEIINKYLKKGMVFNNPKNEDQWGYWARVPEMLPKDVSSIAKQDQNNRIDKKDTSKSIHGVTGLDDGDGLCQKATALPWPPDAVSHFDWKSVQADDWIPLELHKITTTEEEDVAYFRKKLFEPMNFPK